MYNIKIESPAKIDLCPLLKVFNEARSSAIGLSDQAVSFEAFQAMVDGEKILLAKVNNELVGFVSVWEQDNFVHHLFVAPAYQSLGIGAALLKRCQNNFGLPLTLKCVAKNRRAYEFYERNGWELIEKAVDAEGPYFLFRLKMSD